jgi:hypothetical protein
MYLMMDWLGAIPSRFKEAMTPLNDFELAWTLPL